MLLKRLAGCIDRGMKVARYAAFQGDGTLFDTPQRINRGENDPKNLYPDESGFQILELPYKGGEVSMVVIVPRSTDGLATLEKKFLKTVPLPLPLPFGPQLALRRVAPGADGRTATP